MHYFICMQVRQESQNYEVSDHSYSCRVGGCYYCMHPMKFFFEDSAKLIEHYRWRNSTILKWKSLILSHPLIQNPFSRVKLALRIECTIVVWYFVQTVISKMNVTMLITFFLPKNNFCLMSSFISINQSLINMTYSKTSIIRFSITHHLGYQLNLIKYIIWNVNIENKKNNFFYKHNHKTYFWEYKNKAWDCFILDIMHRCAWK